MTSEEPSDPGDVPSDARAAITRAADKRSSSLPSLIQAQYPTLIAIARRLFAGESPGHSLSPTVLVNEAYVRLVDQPKVTSDGAAYFLMCFSRECRNILVDHARRKNAQIRGGGRPRETLADQAGLCIAGGLDVVMLNDAVESLSSINARMGRIAEMRIFGGMNLEECAKAIGVKLRTVEKDWEFARRWFEREMK